MTRSFLVPVDVDSNTPEELYLTAADIQQACESHGVSLAGDVHVWNPPTLAAIPQAPVSAPLTQTESNTQL